MGWVNSLLAKLGNKNAQEAVFLRNARDLYAAALKDSQSSFTEQTGNYTPSSQTAQPVTTEGVDVMTSAQMRQWANQAYAAGQISEETLNQMLEDIDAQEELENGEMDPEKELKRLGMGDGQFSISPIQGQSADYGIGVVLDTNLFEGVNPRNWGKILGDYVYTHLAGTELTVYDDAGNEETVHFRKILTA